MASRFKNPKYFFKDTILIWDEVKNTVTYDDISHIRSNRHFFNVTLPEFNIMESSFFCVDPCFFDHRRGEVDANDFPGVTGFCSGDEAIISGTTSQVDDYIS